MSDDDDESDHPMCDPGHEQCRNYQGRIKVQRDEITRLRTIEATARTLHNMLYVDDAFMLEDGGSPEQIDALMKLRAALGLPA